MKRTISIILSLLLFTTGCGPNTSYVQSGALGAAAGAGLGAITAGLSGGELAFGALLGAAIGIPSALSMHAIYVAEYEHKEIHKREVEENRRKIFANQREIDALRLRSRAEEPGQPDESLREYEYTGPTRGNPFR